MKHRLLLLAVFSCAHLAQVHAVSNLDARVKTSWPRWDQDGNKSLDRREIVTAIKDPAVKGVEAALAVTLYRQKYQPAGMGQKVSLSREEVLALTADNAFNAEVGAAEDRLGKMTRKLFTTGDPNLDTFHQGATGDCFLLANVALFVQQRPQQLVSMFQPQPNGDTRVSLGNGEVLTVTPLTEGELLMGAAFTRNVGVWLNVFEKAYAQVWKKQKDRNVAGGFSEDECLYSEFISGGLSAPTMKTLTGHNTAGFRFGNETAEQEGNREKLHELLTRLMNEKKLVLLHTRRDPEKNASFVKPPGWPDAHTFALFGYDPAKRIVHCFNPWGNDFKPQGRPGLATGYKTENGLFDMPLVELMALFSGLTYETDEPFRVGAPAPVVASTGSTPAPAAAPMVPTAAAAPAPVASPGGETQLLAGFTPAPTSGWQMVDGQLRSPEKMFATVSFPPGLSELKSYAVSVTLRRAGEQKEGINIFLPIAGKMVALALDGYNGERTGLYQLSDNRLPNQAGAVQGWQIQDGNPHTLVIIVRTVESQVKIETKLDGRDLHQWTGSVDTLNLPKFPHEPGHLGLGTHHNNWTVTEMKFKSLP